MKKFEIGNIDIVNGMPVGNLIMSESKINVGLIHPIKRGYIGFQIIDSFEEPYTLVESETVRYNDDIADSVRDFVMITLDNFAEMCTLGEHRFELVKNNILDQYIEAAREWLAK